MRHLGPGDGRQAREDAQRRRLRGSFIASGARVRHVLVGSGLELSWVPAEVLRRTHIGVAKKDRSFVMANGRSRETSQPQATLFCAIPFAPGG